MVKSYGQMCPIACSLDLLGERWTLLIVRELLKGAKRFNELQEILEGIPPNTLSGRLRLLEEHGVVQRSVVEERPPRAEYSLTPAGQELWLPLRALGLWGTRHIQKKVKRVHEGCGGEVRFSLTCDSCHQELQDRDTTMVRRPPR